MATDAGKTTVMGMLTAWSILNKVNDRRNARFSDVVLIVCPNVTIRYRSPNWMPTAERRQLVPDAQTWSPPHLMTDLSRGRVLVTNWHRLRAPGGQDRRG